MARRRLRLVHIVKYFPPDTGGMENFVRDLVYEQVAAGHEVLVLAHAGSAPPGLVHPAPGLSVRRCSILVQIGRYAPVAPELYWVIRRALTGFKPDLIHLHCPNPAGIALWPLPVPLVLHWQSDVFFPRDRAPVAGLLAIWRRLEEGLLDRAALIITTSPDYAPTSDFLAGHLDKCRMIPLGLPRARPTPKPGPAAEWLSGRPAGKRILSIGRLAYYKGFEVMLKALAAMPEASWCLIGDGEEREALERRIRDLRLGERVFLAGKTDDGDREACLNLADVVALPSLDRAEAFGLVLLEGMRAGRACVATRVTGSGMAYAVSHGETGLLATPGNAADLAATLSELLDNTTQRKKFETAGRARFLNCFTIPKIARQIEGIYGEVLASGHA
jgi:rhamnosyl/mannosyltransferase